MNLLKKINFKTAIFLFSFVLIFFFLPADNASALTCAVRAGACNAGETALLKMSDIDNAHAELVSEINYNNYICCLEAGVMVGTNCSGNYDTFLKLQQTTDSHFVGSVSLNLNHKFL